MSEDSNKGWNEGADLGSQEPQEYEFSDSSSSSSERKFSRTKKRDDFKKFVNFVTFPVYTAIGLGDAIITSFEDTAEKAFNKARERKIATSFDEWQDSVEKEIDRLHAKCDESYDKWKRFVTFDKDATETPDHAFEDFCSDIVDSAGKLIQSLAKRGAEVSPIKPPFYEAGVKADISGVADNEGTTAPEEN